MDLFFIFNKKKYKYLIFYLHICNFIRSKLRVIEFCKNSIKMLQLFLIR